MRAVIKYFILFYLLLSYSSASSFIAYFSCGILRSPANLRCDIGGHCGDAWRIYSQLFMAFLAYISFRFMLLTIKLFQEKQLFMHSICAHIHTRTHTNMLIGKQRYVCFVVSYTSALYNIYMQMYACASCNISIRNRFIKWTNNNAAAQQPTDCNSICVPMVHEYVHMHAHI